MCCLPWLIRGYCSVVNQGLGAAALVFGRFWRRARCSTKEIQNYPNSNDNNKAFLVAQYPVYLLCLTLSLGSNRSALSFRCSALTLPQLLVVLVGIVFCGVLLCWFTGKLPTRITNGAKAKYSKRKRKNQKRHNGRPIQSAADRTNTKLEETKANRDEQHNRKEDKQYGYEGEEANERRERKRNTNNFRAMW